LTVWSLLFMNFQTAKKRILPLVFTDNKAAFALALSFECINKETCRRLQTIIISLQCLNN
jgi:hypothetical protein